MIQHDHRKCSAHGIVGTICKKPSIQFYIWRLSEKSDDKIFGRCIFHIILDVQLESEMALRKIDRLTTEELEIAELMMS